MVRRTIMGFMVLLSMVVTIPGKEERLEKSGLEGLEGWLLIT